FGEAPQAGFGHVPSQRLSPSNANEGAGGGAGVGSEATDGGKKKNQRAGEGSAGADGGALSGVTATVRALEDIILHGRKEVEGAAPWKPHRPERPLKDKGGIPFKLVTDYIPAGDQPTAIAELVEGANNGETDQVLLGVTGSGKTFTAAQVIARTNRPALILAPNKTLAAQLYGEFKNFFPDNAVEYFVSYYDYYQPEAYVPR